MISTDLNKISETLPADDSVISIIKNDESPKKVVQASKRTVYEESEKSRCPVELAIRIIGGKWKPIILWHLRDDKKRFGELKREISGITVKMLAQQLRELEQDGILNRKMFYEVPPRVEYSLTDIGRSLEPVMSAMCAWGKMYREKVVPVPNQP